MAMKITYGVLVNDINPSLLEISKLGFPVKVPIAHHLIIAENLIEIEKAAKIFWDTRTKILKELSIKDENGEPIVSIINEASSYKFSDENLIIWNVKFRELENEEVEINLKKLDKINFEGVEGITPAILKGIYRLLK